MRVLLFVGNRRAIVICGLFFLQLILAARPAYPESRVFKCTSAAGQISFSQTGCERGIRESLTIENPEVGWINLKKEVSKLKAKSARYMDERPKRKRLSSRKGGRAQKQRCWKARKKVARIGRELKQGYELARGEALRYQRSEQQEYLALFCKAPKH